MNGESLNMSNDKMAQAWALARGAKGQDKEGYRAEFIKLAETARLLAQNQE